MARGQYAGEADIVANVTVFNASTNNAQNGARIKVFGGSPDPRALALTASVHMLVSKGYM